MKKLGFIISSLLLLPALWFVSAASAAEVQATEEAIQNGGAVGLRGLTIELGQIRIVGAFGHYEAERTRVGDQRLEKGPVRFSINGFDLVMDSVNLEFEDGIIVLENVRSRGAELEPQAGEMADLETEEMDEPGADEMADVETEEMDDVETAEMAEFEADEMGELQARRMLIDTNTWTIYLVGPYRFQNQEGEEGDVLRLELRVEIETDRNVPEDELERLRPHLGVTQQGGNQ